jgi:histone acetyltransferase (RNA polymerase elongator complex component)
VLKNQASRRDPALCGYCKCSHIDAYAALSKTPHALADGLMLVFQHPAEKDIMSLRDLPPAPVPHASKDMRPFIVPVFIPHAGCPHRCVYCNQAAVTGRAETLPGPDAFRNQVAAFLKFRGCRRGRTQIAFFGGNFLGLAEDSIRQLLAEAAGFVRAGDVQGIRFSTRPDTVSRRTLDILSGFPVQTVELGVQSMNPEVLQRSRRGHTPDDTVSAVGLLVDRGYEVGLQIMVGLPGDDENRLMETGRRIAELAPDFVRIYPTVVLSESPLEKWYRQGSYQPLALDAAVDLVRRLYGLFRTHSIPVIRMGLQATEDLAAGGVVLAGPWHPAFGHLVLCASFLTAARRALTEGGCPGLELILKVHPRNISRMRGMRNASCKLLKQDFGFRRVDVAPDPALAEDEIAVQGGRVMKVW